MLKTISLLQYSQFQYTSREFILTLPLSIFVTIFFNSRKLSPFIPKYDYTFDRSPCM